MIRSTPLYAPDGMTSAGLQAERFDDRLQAEPFDDGLQAEPFDDGLVHNHHWAVTDDHARPSQRQGQPTERAYGWAFARAGISPLRGDVMATYAHDRHDDGLVHNHGWAVSGN